MKLQDGVSAAWHAAHAEDAPAAYKHRTMAIGLTISCNTCHTKGSLPATLHRLARPTSCVACQVFHRIGKLRVQGTIMAMLSGISRQ